MTIKPKITSDLMKVVVSSYFRYRLKYKYTATEYKHYDVVACNSKYMTEIEIKISRSDLYIDKEKPKHKYFSGEKKITKYVKLPNYFYYAITEEMYKDELSLKYIQDNFPNYGIMYVKNWREPIIIKKAKIIHKLEVERQIINTIIDRITSENICLRKKLYLLKQELKTKKEPK